MFFRIGSLKNFAILTGQHLYWDLFLNGCWPSSIQACNFFKKRLQRSVSSGYYKLFKNIIFYRTRPMAASGSPTAVPQSQLGCLFFDFTPPRAFGFGQKLTRNVAQILSRDKSIFSLLELMDNVRFQNMFWKSNCRFPFCWKTYTKRCTNNYVISRVKRLSLPALSG